MSETSEKLIVSLMENTSSIAKGIDMYVLAAGFEDRSFHVLRNTQFSHSANCLLIKYVNDVNGNNEIYEKYIQIIRQKFQEDKIFEIEIATDDIENFSRELESFFEKLPPETISIGIDISGMTSYIICLSLKCARKHRPFDKQIVFYTSASEYNPSEDEYRNLLSKLEGVSNDLDEIDYLPKAMALEMSDCATIDAFQGHSSGNSRSCLTVFAGYEVHRSAGTIEAINPSLLLLLFGIPGEDRHSWRLDLSKKLHARFTKGRRCATEEVSTLHIQKALDVLDEYYNNIIDNYDMVIAPVCSKMHSVASYMFWERYGEVQLTFPLPIGYNPDNRPTGIGNTYILELYEQRMLFRGSAI